MLFKNAEALSGMLLLGVGTVPSSVPSAFEVPLPWGGCEYNISTTYSGGHFRRRYNGFYDVYHDIRHCDATYMTAAATIDVISISLSIVDHNRY